MLLTVVLASSLVVTSACSGGSGGSEAADSKRNLLLPYLPENWDVRSPTALSAQLLINEPLMGLDPKGAFTEVLAESVDHPDPETYVYTLRGGVIFSDGSPLTADDVVYTYGLHSAKGTTSTMARYLADVTSVKATADLEVTVKLSAPNPEWPYAVARMGIVSAAHYKKNADKVGTPGVAQIGTGPYVVSNMSPGTSLDLTRNDKYWGDKPTYKAIEFDAPGDDNARLLALQSGDYDGVLVPPLSQLSSLSSVSGYKTTEVPDVATYRLNMDVTKAPFDDPAVRRAVAHAVDRKAMLKAAFKGHGAIANAIVPQGLLAGLGDSKPVKDAYAAFGEAFTYDLKVAADELANSSVPQGFSFELLVQQSDPAQGLLAQILAQSLAKIGIKVSVKQADDNTVLSKIYRDKAGDGLFIDSWNGGSPEPANMVKSAFTPGDIANLSQFDSSAVNEAFTSYSSVDDDATRQKTLLQILEDVHAETPYVPIIHPAVAAIIADDLELRDFTPFWWNSRIDEIITPAS